MPATLRRTRRWPIVLGMLAWLAAGLLAVSASAGAVQEKEASAGSDSHAAEDAHAGGGPSATEDAPAHSAEEDGHGGDAHGDGHGEHDPYDLGHGNASPQLENPANWRYDLALYTFVVFLVVLAVLLKFAWRPIMDGLERRERSIARTIEEAEKKLAQANERLQEYEAKLSEAAHEAKRIVDEAHRNAEAAAERIRGEAEEAARRERERAVQEITLAKEQALQELADHVSQQVFGVARKVLEREVKPDDHQRLIQEALAKLPSKN